MKHNIASPESALSLLQQAMIPCENKRTSLVEGFDLKVLQILLAQAFADDPSIVALPDGRSILVEAMKVNHDLALGWWRMRGTQAWSPTPKEPLPIRVLDHRLDQYTAPNRQYKTLDWSDACKSEAESKTFLSDAIKQGIVLKQSDVNRWIAGEIADEKFLGQLEQQETFLDLCLKQASASSTHTQHRVIRLLLDTDALLIDTIGFENYDLARQRSFPITQPILNTSAVKFDAAGVDRAQRATLPDLWRPWHEVWWSSYDRSGATEVVAWMQKEKIDSNHIRIHMLEERINSIVNGARRHATPATSTWSDIKSAMDKAGGWEMECDDRLIWQSAVFNHPVLASALALDPPPTGLHACSAAGIGLWYGLLCEEQNGSKTSLCKLHNALPIQDNPPSRPVFWMWGPWQQNTEAMDGLFLHATRKNRDPSVWIGTSDKDQLSLAARVMVGLCSNSDNDRAQAASEAIATHLLSDRLDFATPSPFTVLALPLIETMTQVDHGSSKDPASFIDHAAGAYPRQAARLLTLIEKTIKRDKSSLQNDRVQVLQAVAAQLALAAKTPDVSTNPKTSSARPPRL